MSGSDDPGPYPPIGDYGLIGDCHTAALISRAGSIDWCCLPRFDSGSCFGRLIDWEDGGHCQIAPAEDPDEWESSRNYVDGALVLQTTFRRAGGEVRLNDFFSMRAGGAEAPRRQILRIVEGVRGHVEMRIRVEPRFDYGEVRPWLRRHAQRVHHAIGGDDALVISGDLELEETPDHALEATVGVRAGEHVRLSLEFVAPERLDGDPPEVAGPEELDQRWQETLEWWRRWTRDARLHGSDTAGAMRSAMVLKALSHAPTGAIIAAPTTSLPEAMGGQRNWDYRYSWVRDSSFSVRALAELGFEAEADGFRRFILRSAAGHAEDLQILYGVGGERRIVEQELGHRDGYRGSRPVRIGNAASGQLQLDAYGEIVNLTWRWHRRGHSPDDDNWRFLVSVIDHAAEQWNQPDAGLWEWRGDPQHFVHSKALCWAALDRGIRLADECMRRAPTRRWARARDELREAVEARGYDESRGIFIQAFDRPQLDAALLLLPTVEFVAWDDERMIRTADAIREELGDEEGLMIWRYRGDDGLDKSVEGAFLACSFWLAECLARQHRRDDARQVFDRAFAAANDLGLFSEEFSVDAGQMLGNFPQGLTHLAHIAAAVALEQELDQAD